MNRRRSKEGSVVVIALWAVIFMSLLVVSLSYNMTMEAKLTQNYRGRIQAEQMAHNGYEWAKFLLMKQASAFSDEEMYGGEEWKRKLDNLKLGRDLRGEQPNPAAGTFEGSFKVDVIQEPSYRNVNRLTEEDWEQILDNAGVPEEEQPELIDAFFDWTDEGDAHRLNGAEADDKFYKDKDYEVKNGPLDTIDELLLIKGFTEEICFGTEYAMSMGKESMLDEDDLEDGHRIQGIARWLTTFGTGKVNLNSAPYQVLSSMPELDGEMIAEIMKWRVTGLDGIQGEGLDGYSSVNQALAVAGLDASFASRYTVNDNRYVRIVSTGESVSGEGQEPVRFVIRATVRQEGRTIIPLAWREELLP